MIANKVDHRDRLDVLSPAFCVKLFFYKYKVVAVFGLLFSAILYFFMMTHQLTNTFDALWHQNYYHAAATEFSSGRWLLFFVDKIMMGLHADPIASLFALALFVVGFIFVLELLDVRNSFISCLTLALFLSSTLVSNTLSYRYASVGYALAYFLSILALYAAMRVENTFLAVCVSGLFLGLSMSCYQAYSAVFCTVAVCYIISRCAHDNEQDLDKTGSLRQILLRICVSLAIGALFYVTSLCLALLLSRSSLSDYNGVDALTLRQFIVQLPRSFIRTYKAFGAYFFLDKLKINRLQPFGIFWLLLALFMTAIVVMSIRVWKIKKLRLLPLLSAVASLPVSASVYMLLIGDKLELQMTAGLAMLVPLFLIIAFANLGDKKSIRTLTVILSFALLYGGAMQVWFDQEAMYEGQNASETIMEQVLSDLEDENLLSSEYQYYFIGVPSENPLFCVSDVYYCSNAYAQIGNFWVSGNCSQMSYEGLLSKRMGIKLDFLYTSYDTVSDEVDVSSLPIFPNNGYITMVNEKTILVKISEYKPYQGDSKYVFNN